ncbi:MAG: hypothetical protein KGO01_20700, partial [Burkholderiales bacterium]|nr:hypothetical protein [Burkholderiales bacterium]
MSTSHPPLLVPGDVLPGALIGAELDRIAASDAFRRSPRQARMLRHLVALSLGGDRAGLRELPLGVALFDRDPARFDPRQDSIVRVEARRLRHRLAAYYADEGQDARIEFLLPVGSYEVLARRREVPPPQQRRRASLALFDFVEDADRPAAPGSIAHALATELAALLTRLHGLRVVVGGALDGGAPARQAAAKALGVDALLIGRVLAAPPRIEIDLLRAADLESLWSGAQPLAAGTAAALWPLARRLIAELQ